MRHLWRHYHLEKHNVKQITNLINKVKYKKGLAFAAMQRHVILQGVALADPIHANAVWRLFANAVFLIYPVLTTMDNSSELLHFSREISGPLCVFVHIQQMCFSSCQF